MSCTSPLKAFILGKNSKTGKNILKVVPRDTQYIVKDKAGFHYIKEPFEGEVKENKLYKVFTESIELPCGKCKSCQLAHARRWALRMMLELKSHDEKQSWFITLTYDNEHIEECCQGEAGVYSLNMKHVQDFMKRLRKDFDNKLVFFACGEYGPASLRPHYHMVIYDLPLNDLLFRSKSKTGSPILESHYLARKWGKGFVTVQPICIEACAYVARYVTKKYGKTQQQKYKMIYDYGLEPEFQTMSRRPGLSSDYFDSRAPDIYRTDTIYLNGEKFKPPRYFDSKYEVLYPEEMEKIRENRKEIAKWTQNMMLLQTDKGIEDIYIDRDRKLNKQIKALKRSQI